MKIVKKEDLLLCMRNELVPSNPRINEQGLEGFLKYRLLKNHKHPDSIYEEYDTHQKRYVGESITAKYFRKIYKIDPFSDSFGRSDTIFNCWSFTSRFLRGYSGGKRIKEERVLKNLDEYFLGYEEIKSKLDTLANYHHCLANFMPAPRGYNGTSDKDGKGNFKKDNDFPDLFFKRAKDDQNLRMYYEWIQDNMDLLSLDFFYKFNSFLDNKTLLHPLDFNKEDIIKFSKSLDNAIECIEQRASQLFEKMGK